MHRDVKLVLFKNWSKTTFQPVKVCSKWVCLEVSRVFLCTSIFGLFSGPLGLFGGYSVPSNSERLYVLRHQQSHKTASMPFRLIFVGIKTARDMGPQLKALHSADDPEKKVDVLAHVSDYLITCLSYLFYFPFVKDATWALTTSSLVRTMRMRLTTCSIARAAAKHNQRRTPVYKPANVHRGCSSTTTTTTCQPWTAFHLHLHLSTPQCQRPL